MINRHIVRTKNTYHPIPQEEIVDGVTTEEHAVVSSDLVSEREVSYLRTYHVIWFLLGSVETILMFRFILKMIGANMFSGFTQLVYALSYPFITPFLNILPASVNGASIIEWSTVIAMLVYLVLAYGALELLHVFTPTTDTPVEHTTEKTRYAI